MKSDNFRVTIIVACLGALAVAGVSIFFAAPAYRDLFQIEKKLAEAESQVQAQYNNRRKLSETTERIKAARQIIEDLETQFLPNGQELKFITAVENIGEGHGVATKMKLSPSKGLPGLEEYDKNFTLSLTGSYQNVIKTLIDFERLPFLAVYDAVIMNSNGQDDAPVTLDLRGSIASPPKNL